MLRVSQSAIVASLAILVSSGLHADRGAQATVGGGLILGQAVDATTRKGVPGALVSISGGFGVPRRALTTLDGHFVYTGLPPGTYHITATKTDSLLAARGFGIRTAAFSPSPWVRANELQMQRSSCGGTR